MKIKYVILLLLISSLYGCEQSPPPYLRIATNVWPGYEPLYLARSRGYLDQEQVHLVEHVSATQVIRAFNNGSVEAAALTLDEALLLKQYDHNLCISLIMDVSNGSDAIVSKPGFDTLGSLTGARIGVENTALGAYMLSRALDSEGLQLKDVNIIQLEIDRHLKAYTDNRVDAVVTFDPVRSQLLKLGAVQVFDSSEIPGEIIDVLVVKQEYLDRYPEVIKGLKQSWMKALDFMKTSPGEAYQLMSKRLRMNSDEISLVYEGLNLGDQLLNQQLLSKDNPKGILDTLSRLQIIMLQKGLLEHRVDYAPLVQCNNIVK